MCLRRLIRTRIMVFHYQKKILINLSMPLIKELIKISLVIQLLKMQLFTTVENQSIQSVVLLLIILMVNQTQYIKDIDAKIVVCLLRS